MKKNILSMFMAILMLLTIIIPTTTAASATDDGIVLYSEACRYCEGGVIRTTTTRKRTGSDLVGYMHHTVNNHLYSCPKWTAEEHIRVACDKCDTEYSAETNYGTCIVHECGWGIRYTF